MTTILVTGATGTVGSEVVKKLVSSSSSDNDIIIRVVIHSQNKIDNFINNTWLLFSKQYGFC